MQMSTGDSQLKVLIDSDEEVTAKTVFRSSKRGDALAFDRYKNFSRYLGLAAANIGSTLNPSKRSLSVVGYLLLENSSWMACARSFEENSFHKVLNLPRWRLLLWEMMQVSLVPHL